MQRITPFLWFDAQAEEAARFYTGIFKNSKITSIARFGDAGPGPKGSIMTVSFELDGQEFVGLNGGPIFPFTNAVSFSVACKDQAEIDYYWEKLTADGGKEVQCGWLSENIYELISDKNPEASSRVHAEVMKMVKLDIATLQKAYDGN